MLGYNYASNTSMKKPDRGSSVGENIGNLSTLGRSLDPSSSKKQ